jgi:hypothetical protein
MRSRSGPLYAVVGKVFLWGRIIVCERGWKAEIAYPAALYLPIAPRGENEAEHYMRDLTSYGVPVTLTAMREIIDLAVHGGP